eukprot:6299257-Pyramimonas_sp.AAC.1
MQLIVDAHAELGAAPSWRMARCSNGVAAVGDAASPALRIYGVRWAKEENKASSARVRALTTGFTSGSRDEEQAGDLK